MSVMVLKIWCHSEHIAVTGLLHRFVASPLHYWHLILVKSRLSVCVCLCVNQRGTNRSRLSVDTCNPACTAAY